MPAFGVYPVADALAEGDEISSTYEGRHITFLASELTHAGLVVTKGLPVVCGNIVGIAFKTEVAGTDLIAIDTEGIWIVDVKAANDAGNIAVAGGDELYINTTTCVVSKIASPATQVPFGIALGIISSSLTERIAVKLHENDCNLAWVQGIIGASKVLRLDNPIVGAGGSAFQIKATGVAGLQDVGIAALFDATAFGQSTGNWTYGAGIWLNLDVDFIASAAGWAGHEQICPLSLGVYAPDAIGADIGDADIIYGVKAELVGQAAFPTTHGCYFAALNVAQTPADHTAIFYSMNMQSVGMTAINRTVQVGSLAIAFVNGSGHDHVLYVNLYEP